MLLFTLLGGLWLLSLSACRQPAPEDAVPAVDSTDTRSKDLAMLANEAGNLDWFLRVLERVDLAGLLEETGPLTVFAPHDAAFVRSSFALDTLLTPARRDTLQKIMTYHVVRGRFLADQVADSLQVSTLLDEPLMLRSEQEGRILTVNDHEIISTLEGYNGVLHVIGSVLHLPPPDTAQAVHEPPALTAPSNARTAP